MVKNMRAIVLFVMSSPGWAAVPLWFEPNQGQAHRSVQFLTRSVYLDSTHAGIHTEAEKPVVMELIGARKNTRGEGLDALPGITSYFLGNDPEKWRSGIPHYGKIRYRDVYPGIDLIYYGSKEGNLEYDFVLSPGADPDRIEIAWNQPIDEDKNGDLLIAGVRQKRPKVYQNGRRIEAEYRLHSMNHVRLSLASYDRSQTLTVDPVLQYSTYLGGPALEWGSGIQVDSAGSAYITGSARSPASPSLNPFQQVASASEDVYILKLTPSGNSVAFLVVLGGAGDDYSEGIALDSANNAWVAGVTLSTDFPTKNAAQPVFGGGFDDGFYAKVSADGKSIVFASYAGGMSDDWARGIAVARDGSAWIGGYTRSFDFPTKNAYQNAIRGIPSAFLMNVSSSGQLLYATFFGGSAVNFGTGVACDQQGNAYLIGITGSNDFPLKTPFQSGTNIEPGQAIAFLSKFSSSGALVYSTYLGGNIYSFPSRISVDAAGSPHVLGQTGTGFPVKNAAQASYGGGAVDKFVLKMTPDGQNLVYATYLGGSKDEYGYGGLALDSAGNLYVAGHTTSNDFPIKNSMQPFTAHGTPLSGNATITELSPDGGLIFSSFFGGSGDESAEGIAIDAAGGLYITGSTSSTDYPTKNAIQTTYGGGGGDILVAKFVPGALPPSSFIATPISLPFRYVIGDPVPQPQTATLTSSPSGVAFTPHSTASWLSAVSNAGMTPATLTISVDPSALSPGQHSGQVQIDAHTNIQVTLTVLASAPVLASISPVSVPVGSDATTITVNGSGFQQGAVVQVNGASFTTTFVNNTMLRFTMDKSNLTQAATLQVTVVNPQSAASTALTFTIGIPAPVVTAAGVVNAATFASGPVSPGEIISIFGTNLLNSISFDGTPAMSFFSSPTQVNLTVPYSVAGPTTLLQMGATSVGLQVSPSAPGIFAAITAGQNILTLYATGCGALTNDTLPRCALPVGVTINDQPATVLYAGIAPGLVQGANQINVQLPSGITSGPLAIVLTVGAASSTPFSFTLP
jgi:uncharacterized protein (TIGR03437 family)